MLRPIGVDDIHGSLLQVKPCLGSYQMESIMRGCAEVGALTKEEVQVIIVGGECHVHVCRGKCGLHDGGKSWADVNLRACNCSCAQRRSQEGNLLTRQMGKPSKDELISFAWLHRPPC